MKKIIAILFSATLMFGCTKAGEVRNTPVTVKIYGKEYMFKGVILQDESHPVWIMIPFDSTDEQPLTVMQQVKEGKTTHDQNVIILK